MYTRTRRYNFMAPNKSQVIDREPAGSPHVRAGFVKIYMPPESSAEKGINKKTSPTPKSSENLVLDWTGRHRFTLIAFHPLTSHVCLLFRGFCPVDQCEVVKCNRTFAMSVWLIALCSSVLLLILMIDDLFIIDD